MVEKQLICWLFLPESIINNKKTELLTIHVSNPAEMQLAGVEPARPKRAQDP